MPYFGCFGVRGAKRAPCLVVFCRSCRVVSQQCVSFAWKGEPLIGFIGIEAVEQMRRTSLKAHFQKVCNHGMHPRKSC